jgi:hypothetical protein
VQCIKYLLWANMILNIVNIGPTLALTLILKILASFSWRRVRECMGGVVLQKRELTGTPTLCAIL